MLTHPTLRAMINALARGCAGFLGLFLLFGAMGIARSGRYDPTIWLIDLRPLPLFVRCTLALLAGSLLLAAAIKPALSRKRRIATQGCAAFVTLVAVVNSINYLALLQSASLAEAWDLPLSLAIAVLAALTWLTTQPRDRRPHWLEHTTALAVTAVCLVSFPLLQMIAFGYTDYRRPADAIVVFGARTYADGRLSHALADRVRTAVDLYHAGYAPLLIVSGGPGDGDIHETQAMRRFAVSLGVPEEAILLDATGLNTAATIEHTANLASIHHFRSVLAVSHFYHLPRIKLTAQQHNLNAWTVPCKESYTLTQLPWNMAREVAALWVYYLRSIAA